ncbi:hypothetical protein HYH02_007116 [Chlamydomonas schloesseri]|uniref:phytol kinase n=1 Tax=Chlamydomonas schloesseri TaxID=2026947 RepID=A0A835WIL9_9CHLO|nr:hypothetical protein HYH02_007116 [Chlamydomonas schloesseri]|eukprot:KAG2448091.1 hypothetical protein HYH02_007116 [Chlamydomonas schloesseri]
MAAALLLVARDESVAVADAAAPQAPAETGVAAAAAAAAKLGSEAAAQLAGAIRARGAWETLFRLALVIASLTNFLILIFMMPGISDATATAAAAASTQPPQQHPQEETTGSKALRAVFGQDADLDLVRRLTGGPCLRACMLWLLRCAELGLREGEPGASGLTEWPQTGPAARRRRQQDAPAAAAAAPVAVADGGAPRCATLRALMRPLAPIAGWANKMMNALPPAACLWILHALDGACIGVPEFSGGAAGGTGAAAAGTPVGQWTDMTACEAATGAAAASAAARPPNTAAAPGNSVQVYDTVCGFMNTLRLQTRIPVNATAANARCVRMPHNLLQQLLCQLRSRPAAARLPGMWRLLLWELGLSASGELARDVALLLQLQLAEPMPGSTAATAVALPPASAPATAEAAPKGCTTAPSYSLRCALAAGLLPSLEAALRQPRNWLQAFGLGGEVNQLLKHVLLDSNVWPVVLAHGPPVQVASLVASLAAMARRLRSGCCYGAQQGDGAGGSLDAAEAGWLAWRNLCERLGALLNNAVAARAKCAAPGSAPGLEPGHAAVHTPPQLQAQEQEMRVPVQKREEDAAAGGVPVAGTAVDDIACPAAAAAAAYAAASGPSEQGGSVEALATVPGCFTPPGGLGAPALDAAADERQRLLVSLCWWQWMPCVLDAATKDLAESEEPWKELTLAALRLLRYTSDSALLARRRSGALDNGNTITTRPGTCSGAISAGVLGTSTASGITGGGGSPAALAPRQSWLRSWELGAMPFLAAVLRRVADLDNDIQGWVVAAVALMSPAEVEARLRCLQPSAPVAPTAAVASSAPPAGSSTSAAAAAATAGASSGRGIVLCANPQCANVDGPSALFPPGGGKTCARCKAAWYCCGACQLAHWREGGHSDACGKAAQRQQQQQQQQQQGGPAQ